MGQQLSNLPQQITELQSYLRTREQDIKTMREQEGRFRAEQPRVITLQRQLRTNEQEMREQLQEKDTNIASLQERLREEQQQVTELQRNGEEIGTLTRQRRTLQERVTDLEGQLRARRLQEETTSTLRGQLTDLRAQLLQRDTRIATLQEQLSNLRQGDTEPQRTRTPRPAQRTRRGGPTRTAQAVFDPQSQLRTNAQEVRTMAEQITEPQQRVNDNPQDWVINRSDREFQIRTDQELGRGAWGAVFRGKFCRCDVAVKEIHENILSPENRASFEREVDIASKCRHPCLLQFIGAATDERRPFLVTEIMDCTLRSRLYDQGEPHLSEPEISVISLDVALALNYLHQKKPSPIIHSDISSANVLLWRQGNQWRGKVSDYGAAGFVRARHFPGAIIYCAPESLNGARNNQPISCKVDVYSFGVLVCEMCIREQPNPERRARQIARITNRAFRDLVGRCAKREPGERPNMEEIIDELELQVVATFEV